MIEHLRWTRLDFYGVETPLDRLANLRQQADGSILVKPYDPSTTSYIQAVLNDIPGVFARRDVTQSYCIRVEVRSPPRQR